MTSLLPDWLPVVTWFDVGYTFEASLFIVCGCFSLFYRFVLKQEAPQTKAAKIFAIVGCIVMMTAPFYTIFTGRFFQDGMINIFVLTRTQGTFTRTVHLGGFLISLPLVAALVYVFWPLAKEEAKRKETKYKGMQQEQYVKQKDASNTEDNTSSRK